QQPLAPAVDPPRQLAPEPPLQLGGQQDPRLPRLLPEPPGPLQRVLVAVGQRADDQDLVGVGDHLRRPPEPAVGQPPAQPRGHLTGDLFLPHSHYSITRRGAGQRRRVSGQMWETRSDKRFRPACFSTWAFWAGIIPN